MERIETMVRRGSVTGWSSRAVLSLVLAGGFAGCETGSATIRIDDAEVRVERAVHAIAEAIELEVEREQPLGSRQRCELPGQRPGASNTVAVRGPDTGVEDPLEGGAAVLVGEGFELVDSGSPNTIFGRRDGMRVTVDHSAGQVAIDGATGCRALPER